MRNAIAPCPSAHGVKYRTDTIVSRNYLAMAEVLAESFVPLHPGVDFVILVSDGLPKDRN